MKRNTLKSSLLAGLISLLWLFPSLRESSLTDITKPHLGIYECTEAKLGENDYLDRFSYIHLELKTGEDFVLYYQEKSGEKKQEMGNYSYDREKGTLMLIGGANGCFKREFPLKEGILTIAVRIGEQNLSLTFEQK